MYLTAEQARKRATDSNNELRVLMEQIKSAASEGKLNICVNDVRCTTMIMLQNLGYKVEHNMSTGTTLIEW